MNHQVMVSGVHQIDTISNSVPLLGLRLLSKMSQGIPRLAATPPGAHRSLWWDRVLGSHQGEASRFYEAQTDQNLAM